jgi:hypothetical protein
MTFKLFIEYAYENGEIKKNLLNRVSSTTWSTLLSLYTEHYANNVLQTLMLTIFKIAIIHGN